MGKTGAPLPAGSVDYTRLATEIAEVRFTDLPGSRYAFDEWLPVYSASYLVRDKYEQLSQHYRVPFKLLPPGKSDRVGAVLTVAPPT